MVAAVSRASVAASAWMSASSLVPMRAARLSTFREGSAARSGPQLLCGDDPGPNEPSSRLSNPASDQGQQDDLVVSLTGQGSQGTYRSRDLSRDEPNRALARPSAMPPEEKGRLSNPVQRRLQASDIDRLVAAYKAEATIAELADRFGVHRSTVSDHLNTGNVLRHARLKHWDEQALSAAAALYRGGASLATVAARFSLDPSTVANRFRRAGIPIRPRRGWT